MCGIGSSPLYALELKALRHAESTNDSLRVILSDIPEDLYPKESNIWQYGCDTDGCWQGCFTIAAASVAKYWSKKGYQNLWNSDENYTFSRLRQLFPNLFCYNNVNNDGKPSESGYDAFDVATGFSQFISERGYSFTITAIPKPTFNQIVAEINAGRPIIGIFAESPWGSHAATIIGYDSTDGHQAIVVRPNLLNKKDVDLDWNSAFGGFGIVTITPQGVSDAPDFSGLDNAIGKIQEESAQKSTFEVVVDEGDPGFVMHGDWASDKRFGFNGTTRYRLTTDPTNFGPTSDTAFVTWKPNLSFDGIWEVLVYIPTGNSDENVAHHANYRLNTAEGISVMQAKPSELTQGWSSIGSYPFIKGDSGTVYMGDNTGDDYPRFLYADAVRFLWRSPLLIRNQNSSQLYLVLNGKRHAIPDSETLSALQIDRESVRTLSPQVFSRYDEADSLPSVYKGWIGEYFNNDSLEAPTSFIRSDGNLHFQWHGTAPAANVNATGFSTRWTRMFSLTEGEYVFSLEAIGGVRLSVDGQLEIDAWDTTNQLLLHQKSVPLADGLHSVQVEYRSSQVNSQILFGNLPPNTPYVTKDTDVEWSPSPTVTMQWADSGDPDTTSNFRNYFVTLWREEDGQNVWQTTSGWITGTHWETVLTQDGRYMWSVVASDGNLNSSPSSPQPLLFDGTPPWSQIENTQAGASEAASTISNNTAIKITGDLRGAEVIADIEGKDSIIVNQRFDRNPNFAPASTGSRNLPIVQVNWWAADTLSGIDSYDVQVRESVIAHTVYTLSTSSLFAPRISFELLIFGGEEFDQSVIVTDSISVTTAVPLVEFEPVSSTEWITVATNVHDRSLLFLGNPGSTYEFRVRATDNAGNQQPWLDTVLAQVDIPIPK